MDSTAEAPVESASFLENPAQGAGHLDRALTQDQLVEFEDEVELWKTYGGD